jgi:[protein-PII] uridylyltransferase
MVADASMLQAQTPRLLSGLSRELVGDLRGYFHDHRSRVERATRVAGHGFDVARAYTKLYDGVLSALFGACHGAMSQRGQWLPLSLAAVGSYGRRMLSPFSDLDVRLLCDSDTAAAAPAAEALLYPLWDAGLSIGHQVVATDDLLELARRDVTSATALLDLRTIAGDASFRPRLLARAYETVFDADHIGDFVDRLEQSARGRHLRFGDSVYLLEPDVKNGAGGLRDLDVAHWCARARYRVADLSELCAQGVLLPREWDEVEKARNQLLEIRHALHLCAGRRTDRLTFDLQERVTERLIPGGGFPATERLMSDYYRAARVITRLADTLLTRARPAPRRRVRAQALGGGLVLRDRCVALESAECLERDPALALRVYEEAVRRELPVCEHTRQVLARAASSVEHAAAMRASPAASEAFLRLLCVVQRTQLRHGSVLRDMHDVGLLVAMIPEFATLVGRVHRDAYHVYTVDVHSVMAVDHVRAMCRGELSVEHPLASRLAAELPRRQVLLLAALLHDVGKAFGGEGHTERGVHMAREILQRLNVPAVDAEEILTLILHHLSMYEVSTRRDLEDPQTLSEFCAQVRERQTLQELYLLTIADVTTTNPTSMTNWKRRMLDSLFVAADRQLAGDQSRVSPRTVNVRARVLSLWGERESVFIEHFVSGLPERYFYANEPESIVEHALFAEAAQSRAASIRRGAVSHPYFELWVVADDRPGLLASITATLSHSKYKVRSAQVYSWLGQDGRSRSLDIFWLRGPEDIERAERLLSRLERDLEKAAQSPAEPEELERHALSGARGRATPRTRISTEVNIDNKSASNYTVIEVITRDLPSLLFVLSNTLQQAGLSIWFAKINTEGERVIDVFYVSDAERRKVRAAAEIGRVREAIIAAVARLESRLSPNVAKCLPGAEPARPS